jgi:DNA anti-recombination protein RmuC
MAAVPTMHSPPADTDFQPASVPARTDFLVLMFVPVDPFFQLVSGAAAGHVLKGLDERAFRT